ncbi:hypothetical protein BD309DRAFT_879060 [Dichomitus squalens]|nr:hypothetical protein BD309DRAFT_879060 [Dichomitus squalens]
MCYHEVQPTTSNLPQSSLLCVATTELVAAADVIIRYVPFICSAQNKMFKVNMN